MPITYYQLHRHRISQTILPFTKFSLFSLCYLFWTRNEIQTTAEYILK